MSPAADTDADDQAMDALDAALTHRLDLEHALLGAALLDPAAADLLLAELKPRDLTCSIAEAVLVALRAVREDDPVAWATEPLVELVAARLAGQPMVEDLGGRQAVLGLVADRPGLRETREALRAAAAGIMPVAEEPLVALAARKLCAMAMGRSTP